MIVSLLCDPDVVGPVDIDEMFVRIDLDLFDRLVHKRIRNRIVHAIRAPDLRWIAGILCGPIAEGEPH